MNILLISANREKTPYPVFPLGLSYLTGPLTGHGHSLKVLDLCFTDNPESALEEALEGFNPQVAVISIRNIDNVTFPGSRSYLPGVKMVVDRCRGRVLVIVGGSGFSIMPSEIFAWLDADYGIVGEGEEILPELIAAIADGSSPDSLPGVLVKGKDGFLPPRLLQSIGSADRTLFPLERYNRQGGMANLQTKRGCPFSCIYCTYPILEGRAVRVRPVGDVIAEIRSVTERSGIDYIYFVDDIFNYPPEFAQQLCEAMIEAGLKLNWTAFINPAFITPQLLKTMIAAGCDAVEFGSESGSPLMLRNLGKSFTVDDLRDSSRLCREEGVDFAHYILFGGPGESESTIDETFSLMDELEPTAVIAMTGIRIYPGTPLYHSALAEGVITKETSLIEPFFYFSPEVRETLCRMVTERALARKNWVAPGLEINMSDAMMEALRHFPVHGPLWKLMKRLGRSRVKPM